MIDIDDEIDPIKWGWGDKGHPMFAQWFKIVHACNDPNHPAWPLFGGATPKVTIAMRWHDFAKFKLDMGPGFEVEWSKPPRLRCNYLARRDNSKGFSLSNTIWVPFREADGLQTNTKYLETPWGRMSLRDLAKYLSEHVGDDFPETPDFYDDDGNPKPYRIRVREWNPYAGRDGRFDTVTREYTSITAISLMELRKRAQAIAKSGRSLTDAFRDLIRPSRPYGGELSDEFSQEDDYRLTMRHKAKLEHAARLGINLTQYDMLFDEHGKARSRRDGVTLEQLQESNVKSNREPDLTSSEQLVW